MNIHVPAPVAVREAGERFGHAHGRRLAFLHIPKTAGTAFGAALSQRFALAETQAGIRLGMTAGASHPQLAESAPHCRLIGVGAHLDRDKLDAIEAALPQGERLFTVTLLREPRARLISQYRHWRRSVDSSLASVPEAHREAFLAARNLPLGEFLTTGLAFVDRHFRNLQCCMLTGMSTAEMLDEAALLEAARASMAEIDVVGTTAAVDDALARIANAYGWAPPERIVRLNVAPDAPPPPFDDATEAAIEAFIGADLALYREAATGEATAPPPRRLHAFFRPGRALMDSLVDGSATHFTMADALHGRGWHVREGEAPGFARWTGPGLVSDIRLPAPAAQRVELALQLVSVLDWAVVEGAKLTLDGVVPAAPPRIQQREGSPWLVAGFDLPDAGNGLRDLRIEVPFTRSHAEIDPAIHDERQKGIAIGDITVLAAGAMRPPTLGALFWPGGDWAEAAPETLVDRLALARHEGEPPVVERHLGFDLPLMAAILDLVAPDHVWAAALQTQLSVLERGMPTARPSPGGRLAVVATLFELPARGAAIASLAARHEEAVLLLGCAEDHRLRALLANPLLVPHVHLVGCTNAVLVANLAAMRRAGGPELVNGFLLLLERIASTTPELVKPLRRETGTRFLMRLLDHSLAMLERLARGRLAGTALLQPLLPERAPGAEVRAEAVQARFATLQGQADTPLRLVDPPMLASITTLLGLLAERGPESEAGWEAAQAAYDRLFRMVGMLASWEAFGLEANGTAGLARRLAWQGGAPAILPKPLKPFSEYIDFYRAESRIMQRSGFAPGITLTLDSLGGGLDHVVRLNQAAREIELALRLLAKRFPEEEILWVDAGCSYGVLLNTVEPPPALRGRCRFLGFDFNAPGIAVARAAAANAGRDHCRFEVGDVAQAREIAGGARIHLITAFEVLEHCPDPLAVLRDYRAMEPGMLIAGSPLGEPQGVLPGEQHLWSFAAEGYAAMVAEAGFALLGVNRREVGRFIGGHDWVTVTATTGDPAAQAVI
ncbi:methyltransferase domain-containing protein [Falsiroseomonas sp.]|uniref:methyltransferase domain-containing protein n=1 Tax=Falsiroseomonas sp. TaxID=2870721 RepID=UPI0035637D97